MSNSTLLQSIKEARRDVLVNHYIANNVPKELQGKVTNADSLYQYLLLDTKISELVKTSSVAEAISSVQLYINRCIEGYEGELTTESKIHFEPGKFLYNWDAYNKRYATWTGKERLKYYAGSYIDPSLRYNKTKLFEGLEQSISQGRITEENIKNALKNYLNEYKILSDLEYISASTGNDESVLFFVGRTKTVPCEYFWRRLTLKNIDENNLVPESWSEWKKITANIGEAVDNNVIPYWSNNRLHIKWVSIEKTQTDTNDPIVKHFRNDWVMDSLETWSSLHKYPSPGYKYVDSSGSPYHVTFPPGMVFFDNPNEFKASIGPDDSPTSARNIVSFHESYVNDKDFVCVKYGTETGQKEYKLEKNWGRGGFITDYFTFELWNDEGPYGKYFTVNVFRDKKVFCQYGSIKNNIFSPPPGSNIKDTINLSLETNVDLSSLLEKDIDALFDYTIQGDQHLGGSDAFYGPDGLYLWEVFFHIPFLVAVRCQTEQRYELTERWFKFIFNSTGYRDDMGNLLKDESGNVRYWNVVPLQESIEWDDNLSISTTDPDEIALSNPMHYKLAIFIGTIEFLIKRGDDAYRKLERDTFTEAKMYYIQASQLLGSRPEICINSSWPNPTLKSEANAMTAEPTRSNSLITLIIQLRNLLKAENGHFLPPYNDELLAFWDKIDLRLYNLRHNLSLDGQPLYLPLYAEPMNPRDLQIQYSTGDGLEGSISSPQSSQSIYRFSIVSDKARKAVKQTIQFGHTLESSLTKQDTEAMTLLLQSQQQTVLQQTRDIQEKNLSSLQAKLESIKITREGEESTKTYYEGLIKNWMSDSESKSLLLRTAAAVANAGSILPTNISCAADMTPNVFGMATGGARWGAISSAVAQGLQITSDVLDQTANIMDISESYRRRREDWKVQRDAAEQKMKELDLQISALQEQINMAHKQIVLTETEHAHAQAIYNLQSTRFTNQALFNWMVGRLSSLYYQMYDATLSLCLIAKTALEKELDNDKSIGIFTLPAWNDLYQGLLAGEMLLVELQKLDNLWIEENKRGMEAVKTVSLDNLIRIEDPKLTFASLVQDVLNGKTPGTVNGVNVQLQNEIFSVVLDLSSLGLDNSYNQVEKTRRIKNLSVTLPDLLGPYQDVEATLSLNGETVTLSHGVNDSGLFITDLNDSRFLPFEGMELLSGKLILSIFRAGQDGEQRFLLESLNDVIFHIRYVIK
ncbi:TPA: neuraminidase-like domain-containing protein [Bacillus cereus]